jgi:hypothetical protein
MVAANYAMTLCVNTIVTVLIVLRLLLHRYRLKEVLGAETMKLYTGILAVVIESAVPICVFGALSSAMSLVNSQTQFFFSNLWTIVCVSL